MRFGNSVMVSRQRLFGRIGRRGYEKTDPRMIFIGSSSLLADLATNGGKLFSGNSEYLAVSADAGPRGDKAAVSALAGLVHEGRSTHFIIAERLDNFPLLRERLLESRLSGAVVYDAPYFYQAITGRVPINHVRDSWFLFGNQGSVFNPITYRIIKRALDIGLSVLGAILLLPITLFVALAIKLSSKGPVFFRQERIGLDQRPFTVVKFRTMVDNAEGRTGPIRASKHDPRVTRIGRILRRSRLDELPNLVNILKGDMSFVGPRPIRKHFADKLAQRNPYYRLRFKVKPGATGWAQVKGKYAENNDGELEKLEYDLFYVQNQCFTLDLMIFLRTIMIMFSRKGQ